MQIMDLRPDFAVHEPRQNTISVQRSTEQENFLRLELAFAVSYSAEKGTTNEWKQSMTITSTAYVRRVMTLLQGDAVLAYPIHLGIVYYTID